MFLAEAGLTAILLGVAAVISAVGGVVSTILAARRARADEQVLCEEKLRAVRVEAGALAEELYAMKTRAT